MAKPNRHASNQRIFRDLDVSSSLLQLYTRLVSLELALKDLDAANYALAHDVCEMVMKMYGGKSGVAASVTTLSGDLSSLHCSSSKGAPSTVRSMKYPDLRYVRIQSDFDASSSTEAEIARALTSLETLIDELRREGLPWH
jgi:hypothetical protein